MNNQTKLNKVMQLIESMVEPRREDYKEHWDTSWSKKTTEEELKLAFDTDSNCYYDAINKYQKDIQALRTLRDHLNIQLELEYAETLIK